MDDKFDSLRQKIFTDFKDINEFIRTIIDFAKENNLSYEDNILYIAANARKKVLKEFLETLK